MLFKNCSSFFSPILNPISIIVLTFILSRIAYFAFFTLTFESGVIVTHIQCLDINLLRHDLLNSIYYLHQQPPLFNLIIGIVLKLFGSYYHQAFKIIYLIIGLLFALSLFHLMEKMAITRRLSLLLTLIFIVSPTTILFENHLHYGYPVACLLCASALFFFRFIETGCLRYGVYFFSLLATLILIRSLFRPEELLFAGLVLYFACRDKRAVMLRAIAIPLFLVMCFCVKQYMVFGTPYASTAYIGINLAKRTIDVMSTEIKEELRTSGAVSDIYFSNIINPIKPISVYRKFLPRIPITGIAALDNENKSIWGAVNFNHIGYLYQSEAYVKDFKKVVFLYPDLYLKSFKAAVLYFYPASDDPHTRNNNYTAEFAKLSQYYNMIFLGRLPGMKIALGLVIGLPLLLIFGCHRAINGYARLRIGDVMTSEQKAQWLTLCYMLFHITVLTAITLCISWGEYNRYRFDFDSFYLVLTGLLLMSLKERLQRSKRVAI